MDRLDSLEEAEIMAARTPLYFRPHPRTAMAGAGLRLEMPEVKAIRR